MSQTPNSISVSAENEKSEKSLALAVISVFLCCDNWAVISVSLCCDITGTIIAEFVIIIIGTYVYLLFTDLPQNFIGSQDLKVFQPL